MRTCPFCKKAGAQDFPNDPRKFALMSVSIVNAKSGDCFGMTLVVYIGDCGAIKYLLAVEGNRRIGDTVQFHAHGQKTVSTLSDI